MGEPMQASGKGTGSDDKLAEQGGESEGNARGERGEAQPTGGERGVMGHGGQSEIGYHGGSDAAVNPGNPNAGAAGA